jgi:hypothetical protein
MKPDPYKAKASRQWKKKHSVVSQVSYDRPQVPEVAEQPQVPQVAAEYTDTQLLLDLKNKILLDQVQVEQKESVTFSIKYQKEFLDSGFQKSYKGFHDQIFQGTDLEEWLDDILG